MALPGDHASLIKRALTQLATLFEWRSSHVIGDDHDDRYYTETEVNSLISGIPLTNPGGSNRQVQFNDNGSFGSSSSFTFTSAGAIRIATTGGRIAELTANDSEPYLSVGSTSSHSFAVMTNGSRRLTVNASGNVGIGDTSPSYKLDVNGTVRSVGKLTAGDGIDGLTLANGGIAGSNYNITGVNQMTINDEGEGIAWPNVTMYQETGDTDRLTLNGNLLLKATAGPNITIRDTDSSDASGYIAFENNAGTRMGYIGYPNNDDIHLKNENTGGHIFFATQNTYRSYVNSAGHFVPYTNNTYDLGGGTLFWRNAYIAGNIYMGANDYIQYVDGENKYRFVADNTTYWDIYPGRIRVLNTGWTTLGVDGTWGRLETDRGKFYINREIWVDEGKVSSYNENLQLQRAGSTKMTMTTSQNISNQQFKIDGPNRGTGAMSWSYAQLLIESLNSSGSTSTNSLVMVTLHNDRYNVAPMMRTYGPNGESIDFVNNPQTAYIPIRASSFSVNSTIRIKENIEAVEDDDAIAYAEGFLLTQFDAKVRPQTLRASDRFQDVSARWEASAPDRQSLTARPRDLSSHDHDCAIDSCDGSPENPCPVSVNDTRRFGGLAEWWGEVAPEQVIFDAENVADSIDIDQIATTALGATGALSRRLTRALDRIDELEARLDSLEAPQGGRGR